MRKAALAREALVGEPPVREVVWEEVADENGGTSIFFITQGIDLHRFLNSSVRNVVRQ